MTEKNSIFWIKHLADILFSFWYVFSDKVTTLTLVQFVQSVAQYYTPYTSNAMMYVGLAWLANRALISLSNNSNATSAH